MMMKKNTTILIADDDKNARLSLCDIVQDLGFQAEEARDGADTLKKMKEKVYDILLLDLEMPKLTGLQVMQKLQQQKQMPEVIVVTSHASIPNAVQATRLGAYDFVPRDQVEEKLPVVIRNVIEKRQLEQENIMLKKELTGLPELIGDSKQMKIMKEQIKKVSQAECTVLILGESGSGKELVASEIFQNSLRKDKPFVTVNCSALPETLLESELFGHVKGAFTNATTNKKGKFEAAHTGTIFLDEIGDMSLAAQSKLLRVLESGEIEKVGAVQPSKVDVRVIAATNKNLEQAIADKTFREDLYFRINVVTIRVPPLRNHREDIPLLVDYFLDHFSHKTNSSRKSFSKEAMRELYNYQWHGNIRELKNLIQRVAILSSSEVIDKWELQQLWNQTETTLPQANQIPSDLPLEEARRLFESHYLRRALIKCQGNITKTAQLLNLNRSYLHEKMKELGVRG